jgi:hypothetical protein
LVLHGLGRAQMDAWLTKNKKYIGKESSMDIEAHFLTKAKHENFA